MEERLKHVNSIQLKFDPGSMHWCSMEMDPKVVDCFSHGWTATWEEIGCICPSACHDTNYKVYLIKCCLKIDRGVKRLQICMFDSDFYLQQA